MSTAFNVSKHKIGYYWEQAALGGNRSIQILLMKGKEADGTLSDRDNLGAILGAASNVESDFTNYIRKQAAGGDLDTTIDDSGNRVLLDLPDQTWADAGGSTNNALSTVLLCYDPDTTVNDNGNVIPLLSLDITATTDGNDLIVRFHADGAARVN
jgi:hypothetical protein